MAKIHLAKAAGAGGRSVCRYTARPGRQVHLLPLLRFALLPVSVKCFECAAKAAESLRESADEETAAVTADAFHLNPGEEVSCYQCSKDGNHTQYKRGEAFLVGPGHAPYDGSANYFCVACLSPDFKVWELYKEPTAIAA